MCDTRICAEPAPLICGRVMTQEQPFAQGGEGKNDPNAQYTLNEREWEITL
jgi:hypothetical protein